MLQHGKDNINFKIIRLLLVLNLFEKLHCFRGEEFSMKSPEPNKWFHIIFSYNGTSVSAYVDGTPVDPLSNVDREKLSISLTSQ